MKQKLFLIKGVFAFVGWVLSYHGHASINYHFDEMWNNLSAQMTVEKQDAMGFAIANRLGVAGGRYGLSPSIPRVSMPQIISYTPMSVQNLGCGGISFNMGALSVVDGAEIEAFFNSIGPNIKGYVISLAMSALLANAADYLNKYLSKLQDLSLKSFDSCQAAKHLVHAYAAQIDGMCSQARTNSGSNADFYSAISNECDDASPSETEQPKVIAANIPNKVWVRLMDENKVPRQVNTPFSDEEVYQLAMAELAMSFAGVMLNDSEDFAHPPLGEDTYESIVNFALCGHQLGQQEVDTYLTSTQSNFHSMGNIEHASDLFLSVHRFGGNHPDD